MLRIPAENCRTICLVEVREIAVYLCGVIGCPFLTRLQVNMKEVLYEKHVQSHDTKTGTVFRQLFDNDALKQVVRLLVLNI